MLLILGPHAEGKRTILRQGQEFHYVLYYYSGSLLRQWPRLDNDCAPQNEHSQDVGPATWIGVVGWAVLVGAGILVYIAHYYINEHSASIRFFADVFLSFALLIVVTIQSSIYYRQSQLMEQQHRVMVDQLKTTIKSVRVAERSAIERTNSHVRALCGIKVLPHSLHVILSSLISEEVNGFGLRALWVPELLHPGEGYFIEAFSIWST